MRILLVLISIPYLVLMQPARASLTFQNPKLELGKVRRGKTCEALFSFTNKGNKPLIISAIEPTCGCTVVDYDYKPTLPKHKGGIKVSFKASAIGKFNRAIYVTSNSESSLITIYLSGEVIQ